MGDFTKWRQAMRTHGINPVSMLGVVSKTSCVRVYAHAGSRTYLPDDTVPIRKLTHIVANAELRETKLPDD